MVHSLNSNLHLLQRYQKSASHTHNIAPVNFKIYSTNFCLKILVSNLCEMINKHHLCGLLLNK